MRSSFVAAGLLLIFIGSSLIYGWNISQNQDANEGAAGKTNDISSEIDSTGCRIKEAIAFINDDDEYTVLVQTSQWTGYLAPGNRWVQSNADPMDRFAPGYSFGFTASEYQIVLSLDAGPVIFNCDQIHD